MGLNPSISSDDVLWILDCIKWRSSILAGKYKHWCLEWDGLPVDETCGEFTCCECFDETEEVETLKAALRAGMERCE